MNSENQLRPFHLGLQCEVWIWAFRVANLNNPEGERLRLNPEDNRGPMLNPYAMAGKLNSCRLPPDFNPIAWP